MGWVMPSPSCAAWPRRHDGERQRAETVTRSSRGGAPGREARGPDGRVVSRASGGSGRRPNAAKLSQTGPESSRVTPRAEGAASGKKAGRSLALRIAVVAFVVVIMAALFVGCARYDGDRAAFCAQLGDTPSFMELSAKANSGTRAQATRTMEKAASEFRALERTAPRSIRHTVAALGDSAERIAQDLAPEHASQRLVTVIEQDGTTRQIPVDVSESQERLGVFYTELQNHHGTPKAIYSLMNYARTDCGITDRTFDLGMAGLGATQPGIKDFGSMGDPWSSPFGDPTQVQPQPSVVPGPGAVGSTGSGTSGGEPGSTPAPMPTVAPG